MHTSSVVINNATLFNQDSRPGMSFAPPVRRALGTQKQGSSSQTAAKDHGSEGSDYTQTFALRVLELQDASSAQRRKTFWLVGLILHAVLGRSKNGSLHTIARKLRSSSCCRVTADTHCKPPHTAPRCM